MITKSTYELISDVISDELKAHRLAHHDNAVAAITNLAHELAKEFQLENANFKRGRWLMECGIS